jgi:hypothetical protein
MLEISLISIKLVSCEKSIAQNSRFSLFLNEISGQLLEMIFKKFYLV